MIPESVITSEIPGCETTAGRATAVLLYTYLDLRQGAYGHPVRGFRHVGRAMGMQGRSVGEVARRLASAGLIELDVAVGNGSAVMSVVHNPARGRFSSEVSLGPPPFRYRNDPPAPTILGLCAAPAHRCARGATRRPEPWCGWRNSP